MAGAVCLPSLLQAKTPVIPSSSDPVLVILNLTGGNDGLNTLIPHDSSSYHSARPSLGLNRTQTLSLNSGPKPTSTFGLHPSFNEIVGEWQRGNVAFINKVGYQGADQSHFHSRDIWSQGYVNPSTWTWPDSGWIARYKDLFAPERYSVIGLKTSGLKDFSGGRTEALTLQSVLDLSPLQIDRRYPGNSRHRNHIISQVLDAHKGSIITKDVAGVMQEAITLVDRLHSEVSKYKNSGLYPSHGIGESFRDLAVLMSAGIPTRVAYLTLDGFDTHASQANQQADLFGAIDDSVGAFATHMRQQGHWNRIVIAVISEFGRRTQETSSGTDHGDASVVTLIGGGVNGGVYGDSITESDLQLQNLPFATDFREIYWELLANHMQVDPKDVFKVMPRAVSPLGFV